MVTETLQKVAMMYGNLLLISCAVVIYLPDVDAIHEDLDNLPMDVKNFLSGRTNARSIARRRSMKFLPEKTKV